jgi:hypothetical protein
MVAPGLFVWDWSEGVERTRYRPPRLAKGVYRKRDRKLGHPGLARLVVASPQKRTLDIGRLGVRQRPASQAIYQVATRTRNPDPSLRSDRRCGGTRLDYPGRLGPAAAAGRLEANTSELGHGYRQPDIVVHHPGRRSCLFWQAADVADDDRFRKQLGSRKHTGRPDDAIGQNDGVTGLEPAVEELVADELLVQRHPRAASCQVSKLPDEGLDFRRRDPGGTDDVQAEVIPAHLVEGSNGAIETLVVLEKADAEETEGLLVNAKLPPGLGAFQPGALHEGAPVFQQANPFRRQSEGPGQFPAFPLSVDERSRGQGDQPPPQSACDPAAHPWGTPESLVWGFVDDQLNMSRQPEKQGHERPSTEESGRSQRGEEEIGIELHHSAVGPVREHQEAHKAA